VFERFTRDARQVVERAQDEARELHSGRIGTEHLLLALLAQESSTSSAVLARHGLTHRAVRESVRARIGSGDLDADALTALGIDLDAVRGTVEASFGPGALDAPTPRRRTGFGGHIPFSPRAKKVLELSLRESLALKQRTITDGHITLGLLRDGDGLAMDVLTGLGADPVAVRRDVQAALLA
jgi:ATP-dependent Clp protease ATP-binding subunit ClpA